MTAQDNLEKLQPRNEEAEMAVLGSMLIAEDAISHAIELLEEACFYKDTHRKIFNAIVDLFDKNKSVDLITTTEALKKKNLLDDVGGASYIASLTQTVPTAANIKHYAKIVREKYIMRSLITVGTRIVTEAYKAESSGEELLDRAERMIFEVTTNKSDATSIPIKEIIKDSIEAIDGLYQRKENITGVATGFHEFDILTAGLQPSDLIIVAGRPSMGKSALASCIAEHSCMVEKVPTVIFSVEMSREQLAQRMLCSHARVDFHKVRTGFLSQSDWPKLTNAAGRLSESPLFIDDTPSISALELRAKARRLKSQYDIGLVIIDYMQLMRGPSDMDNRQQEISEISRSLKALARELHVPVIGISQLSRAVETRADKRPQLSDLRESGAIEQDADIVAFIYRDEVYNKEENNPNKGIAEIIVAKQRNGPTGTALLSFLDSYTRFENYISKNAI